MAAKDPKPPEISMKNTKAEMLEAYNEMLEMLKQKRQAELKPAEVVEEKKAQEVVEVTDSLSTEKVVQTVGALRTEMGKLLGALSDQMEEEIARYRQVRQAVAVKEKELHEIYDIEKSALSLAALIEAQHQTRQQTEAELSARREELMREIETTRAEWQKEQETHEAEVKRRDAEAKKERERQREEYEYVFTREQQLAREQFEDERARMERDITNRREQMERELAERERAVVEHEKELGDLRKQVAAFPNELETAINKAVGDAVKNAQSTASATEELLRKEFDGERNVLTTRIESLEKTVREQAEQIGRLSQQVEKAYGQVQDIATRAIESASPSQSLGNMQRLMAEQNRRTSPEA